MTGPVGRPGPAAGALGFTLLPAALLAFWASTWTGGPESGASVALFIAEAARGAMPACCWMAMALGFGWPLRRLLVDRSGDGASANASRPLQLALGVAAALWLDATLGTLGAFGGADGPGTGRGAVVAWGMVALGAGLAIVSLRRRVRGATRPVDESPAPSGRACWLALAAAPALAALAVAASSAPGWLWSSEFGGYDALSYHLQLPREWLAAGRIAPPTHNVYGFLPSFMESAFLQLMAMRGGAGPGGRLAAHEAAIACQWLHALMTVGAAWCTGACAAAWTRPRERAGVSGMIAAILVLATPWTIVVGSLAYSEMPTCMFLAAGLTLLAPRDRSEPTPWFALDVRRAAALGLLAGAACGAKLTAAGFVAAPLATCALLEFPPRRWAPLAALGGTCAALVLLPWLARNAAACGNPFFPFASGAFGSGHWDADQVATFARGHRRDGSLGERAVRFARQVPLYGLGENPEPGEPWLPQWSFTPWLGTAGIAALAWTRTRRSRALRLGVVLAVQAIFWLFFTHLQSRFFLPAVVPLAVAAGIAGSALVAARRNEASRPVIASWRLATAGVLLLALSWAPLSLFARERQGAPAAAIGQSSIFTGDAEQAVLVGEDRRAADEVRRAPSPALVLNHLLAKGRPGRETRVLLVGESRPFWFRGDTAPRGDAAAIDWQTTWDRGPLSAAMRNHPDDPAAWSHELVEQGITHVLVDPAMLGRWERSGWNDPLLTPERTMRLAAPPNAVLHRFPGDALLIELSRG